LRDKAGREGFIDSVATKTLKKLVENILKQTARDYFGSASEIRQEWLPNIQSSNKEAKANEERNKLRKKQRSQFRAKLKVISNDLPNFLKELAFTTQSLEIKTVDDISFAQEKLDEHRTVLTGYRLPGVPQNLGSLEEDYSEYRKNISESNEIISRLAQKIDSAIQLIKPANPKELIEKQLQRNAGQLHSRIRKWQLDIKQLQEHEQDRIKTLIDDRNKLFHAKALPLVGSVERGDITLTEASELMEMWRSTLEIENADIFESYIRALDSLTESIDLEFLAIDSTEENDDLRAELDRLNGLAQLGISVEILGHELQSYDDMIGRGIGKLSTIEQNTDAVSDIRIGYEGLTNQLRFLSPLKLSGEKIQKWITGKNIFDYVTSFYSPLLERKGITFSATKSFLDFRVFDQPARLFPVFINLVNNSMFWVNNSEQENKEIKLDIFKGEVVISDNGPGVDELDVRKLFSLFFTKKIRGGRGVGLYLAKANLAAGGHKIRYEENVSEGLLSGANFIIQFKGAEYGS
jgi:signal transduction histidine kinase